MNPNPLPAPVLLSLTIRTSSISPHSTKACLKGSSSISAGAKVRIMFSETWHARRDLSYHSGYIIHLGKIFHSFEVSCTQWHGSWLVSDEMFTVMVSKSVQNYFFLNIYFLIIQSWLSHFFFAVTNNCSCSINQPFMCHLKCVQTCPQQTIFQFHFFWITVMARYHKRSLLWNPGACFLKCLPVKQMY